MQSWSTRLGVILAVTGSAVGLGNFLRFPGLVAEHGGAFIIPYVIAFLIIGLPVAWMEWTMGRAGGARGTCSVPGIMRALGGQRWLAYPGALAPAIPIFLCGFYLFVEAWCLAYAWKYLIGTAPGAATAKQDFLQWIGATEDHGYLFLHGSADLWGALLLVLAINGLVIWFGVSRGIERVCTWAMPLLIAIALLMVGRVLTLPPVEGRSVLDGLAAMWEPREVASKLTSGEVWLAAAGQIFFSLSVGIGAITTYAAYMRRDTDVALSGLTAAAGNEFCEVALGGMIVVPAAFVFLGASYAAYTGSSIAMGFFALPGVFEAMPAGRWFGFLFFVLLSLAALTSSLSMIQPSMAFIEEALGWSRRRALLLVFAVLLAGLGIVVWACRGTVAIDTLDFWAATLGITAVALITALVFNWAWGTERGIAELRREAEIALPPGLGVVMRWLAPLALLIILGWFLWGELQAFRDGKGMLRTLLAERGAQLAMAWMLATIALYLAIARCGQRRWDALITKEAA
ncbi:MAG: sodium:calcium symporter [Planctomycetota bacterium]|nr:sodium:calcium symporter [Planctomycetota bacterium]MCX8038962.1 sodium:calcium symporter [Planctomycetota bacterium]MDW8372787.1 sodium:calcium symporter [Planctomycetota bacterium]